MARRTANPFLSRSFQRTLTAMTRTAVRAGSKALKQTLRAAPSARKSPLVKRTPAAGTHWSAGVAVSTAGARRYRLFKPPGVRRTERLPLLVMLHGCGQDAQALAASSQMNRIASRERFLVLYPEQDRLANAQGCWSWYDTRSGRAQREADTIAAAIDQVCRLQPVDPERIALAGLSAGAGMASLLATRHPERFRAVAMHSGIAPGVAHSSATALGAMRGRRAATVPLVPLAAGAHLPALLVIQGSADHLVVPSNGVQAAQVWAAREGAQPGMPRTVQRGARYAATITDYRMKSRLVATLCEVNGLGHAWSGGAAGRAYSDPKGPDASRMIWAFAAKQFASARA
jgi:poly(hydroxyalkanoate) depolymerase family esterase